MDMFIACTYVPPLAAAGAFLTPPGMMDEVELLRMLGALDSIGARASSS